jgi:hypothetical protein
MKGAASTREQSGPGLCLIHMWHSGCARVTQTVSFSIFFKIEKKDIQDFPKL